VHDTSANWWRDAVIYQVYIRSFADGDGDGLGDIAGLRSRLPYLADLGVDAIWINPWYPSPMADAGYDVSDYRDVEPRFGTMADAEALIAEAHEHGLRVLLDIVPNHSSDQHPWFQEALAAGPGSPARERFIFRDGVGDEPPNDWPSQFGGPTWTRTADGQWYLHIFAPEQPDWNWLHPDVRADFEATLRFWFDRGVDGFRIDVAHSLFKADGLPDVGDVIYPHGRVEIDGESVQPPYVEHPFWDRDELHDVYREWREIADSYDPPRIFVAEAWVSTKGRLPRYVRPDELNTTFNFEYLVTPWTAQEMRRTIDETLTDFDEVGAPSTWVLSNHDVVRHVSRYARFEQVAGWKETQLAGRPYDLALGDRRARAALLLTMALPGGAYVYQGEELGLPEIEDLPEAVLQDPTWERSSHTDRGRDGCRVPIPWSGDAPPYGFGPGAASASWLPQPDDWKSLSVEAESADPESMLSLYREALRLRRETEALGDGTLTWRSAPGDDALVFERAPGFLCIVNFGETPVPIPEGAQVLLATTDVSGRAVPQDAAVWLVG
jgi:alpha-glucosidase